jgi:zinc protease
MPERTIAVHPPPVAGAPPRPRVPRPERWTTAGGLRVVALPRRGVPQVVLKLVLPAGAAADPAVYPGAAALVGHLLTEGTAAFGADELNERLDGLGASVSAGVGHDFAEVEAVLLADTLAEGIALLAEIVARPAFPERETERVRAESLDALLAREDEPSNVADDRVSLEIFGARHPYGIPAFGTKEGIAAVPREALAAFHAARYRPGGAFLVAAGDFEAAELRARLDAAFAGWSGRAEPIAVAPPPNVPPNAGRVVVARRDDAAQSEIRVGGPGLDRRGPDWFAAGVANYVLGGSTITGRLGANLREEKGWTYGARSAFHAGLWGGAWIADTAVDVAVTADAVAEIVGEARRMATEPVGEDELRRAKDALILSLPRVFETAAGVASRFVTVEAFGLPDDYWERYPERVEAVTAGQVLEIARRRLDPDALVRVVVGGW